MEQSKNISRVGQSVKAILFRPFGKQYQWGSTPLDSGINYNIPSQSLAQQPKVFRGTYFSSLCHYLGLAT
ncbi:unnamed protein product [Linum tenue]|uniref:Mannose-6-phosphate isomerase n=1 Tax=Linum tenue TaxID=586396 RepID=A0AAV0H1T6_9ROSI|nr:unnamed protein product [Linum tenue]